MNFKRMAFLGTLVWILTSCASTVYSKQESALIVFKTPSLKYADLGFIYENKDAMKIELYESAQPVMALKITQNNICMSLLECMSKEQFNQNVLNQYYEKDTLDTIFKGEVVFQGMGKVKTRNGFTQHISKTDKYNIEYSVLNKQIIFHDTMNNILIKVKRL